jgi:nucleotide-binding universal stress UspA family protein
MLERILVPLDGSAIAEAILVQVGRLLRRKDSEVLLLRVAETDWLPTYENRRLAEELPKLAQEYVVKTVERLQREGIRARGIVAQGAPATAILTAATEQKASLIAMTTHGRTGLLRFTLGSVAEKILRASPTPVFVVRSAAQPPRDLAFRTLLVPVDGSDRSLEVLPLASTFAAAYDARILVVTANDTGEDVDEVVQRTVALFVAAGNAADGEVIEGNSAAAILEIASRRKADAIAMATHGRGGPLRWVLGSVTEKIVRHADVPMLVVRTREQRIA